MYAAVARVSISDFEAAKQGLKDQVVPGVSSTPGFVSGTWMHFPNGKGMSVSLFETEEKAQAFASQFQPPADAPVTLDGVEVAEVVASA
jgi:hypothetical protein